MQMTLNLWLPILVSAVAIFFASSLIHMVLKWHNADYRKLPNEDEVAGALRNGRNASVWDDRLRGRHDEFLAFTGGSVQMGIWMGKPWRSVVFDALDGAVYAAICAGVFSWLWV